MPCDGTTASTMVNVLWGIYKAASEGGSGITGGM
jgi:hypothetical protein